MAQPKKVEIWIKYQTWKESLGQDITTLGLLTGLVWLNEATFASATLNFLFGLMGLLGVLTYASNVLSTNPNKINVSNAEEALEKVRKRLAEIDADR